MTRAAVLTGAIDTPTPTPITARTREAPPMSEKTTTTTTTIAATGPGAWLRSRLGRSSCRGLHAAVSVLLLVAATVLTPTIGLYAAVAQVPNLFAIVANGTGVTSEAGTEMFIAAWLAPSVFLCVLLMLGVLLLLRAMWRLRARLGAASRAALVDAFADDVAIEATAAPTDAAPTPRASRRRGK